MATDCNSPFAWPLSNILFANISSHSVCCVFTFLMVVSESQKFLILMKSNLFTPVVAAHVFGAIPEDPLPNPRSLRFTSVFPSKSFIDYPFLI